MIDKTANEYEYVPRDYGYDYAPPSLMVPAHSTGSSAIQHHSLRSMVYSEEPQSELSDSAPSLPSRSSRHVEYKVRKPSKSHWRPSEKEQRHIISEQQKRRRADKIKEFQRLHGHRPASYLEERDQPQSSHLQRDEPANDSIRQRVERVLTAHDYQSLDSALQVAEEKKRRTRYSTGQTVQNHVPSSRDSSHINDLSDNISRPRSKVRSSRNDRDMVARQETLDHGFRQSNTLQSDVQNKQPPPVSLHDHHILYVKPCHGSTAQKMKADPRERKRSIEQSFDDYLSGERGWVPTELVRAQVVPPRKSSSPQISLNATGNRGPIAPTVPKKRGFFQRILGIGKPKKSRTPKYESTLIQPGFQTEGTEAQYQPSRSYTSTSFARNDAVKVKSHPMSVNSSTTQALSYSTGPSYDHYEPLQAFTTSDLSREASLRSSNSLLKLHQSSDNDHGHHGSSLQSLPSRPKRKIPKNAVRVLPQLPPKYHDPQEKVHQSSSGSQKAPFVASSGGSLPLSYHPASMQEPFSRSQKASSIAESASAWALDHRGAPVQMANRASDRLGIRKDDFWIERRSRAPRTPSVALAPAGLFNFSCV